MALEFGIPPRELGRRISERDFFEAQRYAEQRGGLPQQRIEVLLAKIAMLLDVGLCGNKSAKLQDYLPDGMREDHIADEVEVMHGGGASGTVIKMSRERLRPYQVTKGHEHGR